MVASAAAVLIGLSLLNARYAGPVNPKPTDEMMKAVSAGPQGSSNGWYVSDRSS